MNFRVFQNFEYETKLFDADIILILDQIHRPTMKRYCLFADEHWLIINQIEVH